MKRLPGYRGLRLIPLRSGSPDVGHARGGTVVRLLTGDSAVGVAVVQVDARDWLDVGSGLPQSATLHADRPHRQCCCSDRRGPITEVLDDDNDSGRKARNADG